MDNAEGTRADQGGSTADKTTLARLTRGFLPDRDPLAAFPGGSELRMLDQIGHDLPSLLQDRGFRNYVRQLRIPAWPAHLPLPDHLPALRLYYVRLGFLASAYVNQVGEEPARVLPANIAVPLCHACGLLERPPILSYDGYALYNWRRFVPDGPIALSNIDTIQNFIHMYDEHWFILVHVEIEAIAAEIIAAIGAAVPALHHRDSEGVNASLRRIQHAMRRQIEVLRRIPEKMDPRLYYKTFRPYIRFFEHVVYEGVTQAPIDFRGETGAQSSIMPTLIAFLKIPHQPSPLMNHLADMRNYMPALHRDVIAEVAALPPVRELAEPDAFNGVLDALATFRETHYGWARQYIQDRTDDPRGTGGTPYTQWLQQLIDETRAWRL